MASVAHQQPLTRLVSLPFGPRDGCGPYQRMGVTVCAQYAPSRGSDLLVLVMENSVSWHPSQVFGLLFHVHEICELAWEVESSHFSEPLRGADQSMMLMDGRSTREGDVGRGRRSWRHHVIGSALTIVHWRSTVSRSTSSPICNASEGENKIRQWALSRARFELHSTAARERVNVDPCRK